MIEIFKRAGRTVVLYSEAVCRGLELYDIYALDGDKIGLFRAALDRCRQAEYIDALSAAEKEIGMGQKRGGRYFFGGRRDFDKCKISIPESVRKSDFFGYFVLYAARNGKFAGFLLFREKILQEAKSAVDFFSENGYKTMIIGKSRFVSAIGSRIGADETQKVILKIEKEKVLQEIGKSGKIIVVESQKDIGESVDAVLARKREYSVVTFGAICTAVLMPLCVIFPFFPWLGIPILTGVAAFVFYSSVINRRPLQSLPYFAEEETMFGKVNYTMHIGGMSCAHCSARVKSVLEEIRGVSASVSLEEKVARIKCPASLDVNKLSDAVSGAGFTVASIEKV